MKQHVIVTGGAGYIGSHAAKALAQAGFIPVTYDNLSTGNRFAVRWGPLEDGDILDATRLDAVFAKYRPVGVLHFAALSVVSESVNKPHLYHRVNVGGSFSVMDAARRHGNVPFVLSSTCAVYGAPASAMIDERTATNPISPYGATKLEAEKLVAAMAATDGLPAMVLRYFNAAGADPEGEIGECRDHETHLIPRLLAVAAGEQDAISVFGTDYDTADGTAVRDYIHVSDLAAAHVAALRHLLAGGIGETLNLGTGHGISVGALIAAAERVSGRTIRVQRAERRPGDPPALIADTARASALLPAPRLSSVDTILQTAWRWQKASTAFRRPRQAAG
ncbi:UDP-glucose 4-epimerase GalE [Acuticoccus sp. MNP-M23]|uniref:UDP-glucose 4-epimerase GalE n=1 Tax=Acuticoccus sp. MNP-M23 TaxID=3072793 RepID=UPI0028159741|nr:UDP-glucose 4-epimerase GalE [Acuticoccus sp. MNP-M23]WMS42800.1 UDP-glucose 4-epimerase GalE [Acuticoccus sp. MNP-M23]